ncbi:MAG: acyl-CoA dehydrogenase family protein, partial [Burkholderiales bacterium]|nr:acyl-CoA dehydrogenase family protein [Burkholderiales bacterium]
MNFDFTPKVRELQARVSAFMEAHVLPNDQNFHAEVDANRRNGNAWIPTKLIEELKVKARAEGLWNLWRPVAHGGTLNNLEYAPLCEIMGRVSWGPEVFNCSA